MFNLPLKYYYSRITGRLYELPVLILMPHSRCNCKCGDALMHEKAAAPVAGARNKCEDGELCQRNEEFVRKEYVQLKQAHLPCKTHPYGAAERRKDRSHG
jgi:hypothetical protein